MIFCPPLPMIQPMRSFGMAISVVVCCCCGCAGRACGTVLVALGYAAAMCGNPGIVATDDTVHFKITIQISKTPAIHYVDIYKFCLVTLNFLKLRNTCKEKFKGHKFG